MGLSKFHHTLEGKDLGQVGAGTITRLLLQQVEDIEERFIPKDVDWEQDILNSLRLSKGVEEGSKTVQAYILYHIRKHWEDLSIDFRLKYNNQFDVLVYTEVKVLPTTMDEYLKTIETYFIKGAKPFGMVEVPMRDQFKHPITDEEGNVKIEYKEFDPASVPITKLNLSRPIADREQMNEKRWAMLMDSAVTVEQLQTELFKPESNGANGSKATTSDPSQKFYLDGCVLVVQEFGETVEFGELFFDVADQSDIARNAIFRLLRALSIPFDQDEIVKASVRARNIVLGRVYEAGGSDLLE